VKKSKKGKRNYGLEILVNICHMDLTYFQKVAIKKDVINSIVDSFDLDEVSDVKSLELLRDLLE
jgi:hypothetical protein